MKRPRIGQPGRSLAFARRLNGAAFTPVYDLQTSGRSGRYFRLLGVPFSMRRPQWSGIVRGCSHRHDAADRTTKHSLERQADQLAIAGIAYDRYPALDLDWADVDILRHAFVSGDDPYVLLVPGGLARAS